MSSSPTPVPEVRISDRWEFQSAVAHELFSDASLPGRARNVRRFQSAVAHELFSDFWRNSRPFAHQLFQSAVAHELFSDSPVGGKEALKSEGFKALSRMSSSPTQGARAARPAPSCFKALSRMSSSPTSGPAVHPVSGRKFQSAVAHELFSDGGGVRAQPAPSRVSKRCRA